MPFVRKQPLDWVNKRAVMVSVVIADASLLSPEFKAAEAGRITKIAEQHFLKHGELLPATPLSIIRHQLYRFLHRWGIHEYVRFVEYDYDEQRLIDPGGNIAGCRNCV